MLAGLLIAFLACTPVAAIAASNWAAGPQAGSQLANHQVRAVLTRAAADPVPLRYSGWVHVLGEARWMAPDRVVRTGRIPVPPGSLAGQTFMVWVTAAGRLAEPASDVARQRLIGALLAVLCAAVIAFIAFGVARLILNRCRMAAWDAAWQATGPRWSRRRG